MKLITMHPIIEGAPVIADEIQGNISDITSALCAIDGRLLPPSSVGLTELGTFQITHFDSEPYGQVTTSSGLTTWAVMNSLTSVTDHVLKMKVLPDSTYSAGWNKLSDLDFTYGPFSTITIPSNPGRIVGGATIDSELRCSVGYPYTPIGDLPYSNRDLWWEFGVFADGTEVGRSPRLTAGRHSITIPFVLFSGAEEVVIDIRVRVYFGKQMAEDTTARNREPLALWNFQVWANSSSK